MFDSSDTKGMSASWSSSNGLIHRTLLAMALASAVMGRLSWAMRRSFGECGLVLIATNVLGFAETGRRAFAGDTGLRRGFRVRFRRRFVVRLRRCAHEQLL